MKKLLKNMIFGAVIGASVLIPGMNGGTSALILGIYNDIISAIDELFSDFKKNMPYLLTLTIGAALSFYICSFPIRFVLERFAFEFSIFVVGVIFGSFPVFTKGMRKFKFSYLMYIFAGFIITIIMDMASGIRFSAPDNPVTFIAVGLLSAVALILPGISLTYILIAFGYYDRLIVAVNEIDLLFILKFGTVIIIGIFAFTRLLNTAYKKYPVAVNMTVLGMVAASVKQVFIRMPVRDETLSSLLLFIAGISVSLFFAVFKKDTD